MKLNERIEEVNYKVNFLESISDEDNNKIKKTLREIEELTLKMEDILNSIDIYSL